MNLLDNWIMPFDLIISFHNLNKRVDAIIIKIKFHLPIILKKNTLGLLNYKFILG